MLQKIRQLEQINKAGSLNIFLRFSTPYAKSLQTNVILQQKMSNGINHLKQSLIRVCMVHLSINFTFFLFIVKKVRTLRNIGHISYLWFIQYSLILIPLSMYFAPKIQTT